MSAQRRTANKRAGTATGTATRSAATATAPTPAPAAPSRPASTPPRTASERPKPAAPSRGEAVAERTQGIRKLVRDTITELRKVNWPDQETTRNLTVVVIGISTVIGLALGGIDFVLLKLLEALP